MKCFNLKSLRKFGFMLLTYVISISNLHSQSLGDRYKTALGVKFYPTGITLKTFIKPSTALEFIGYFYNRGSRITGLYEYHGEINNAYGLRWYVGPGAHVAFYNANNFNGNQTVGLDGILGLDYKFRGAPINISIDWQPSFEFGDYTGFTYGWGGFSARFTF